MRELLSTLGEGMRISVSGLCWEREMWSEFFSGATCRHLRPEGRRKVREVTERQMVGSTWELILLIVSKTFDCVRGQWSSFIQV